MTVARMRKRNGFQVMGIMPSGPEVFNGSSKRWPSGWPGFWWKPLESRAESGCAVKKKDPDNVTVSMETYGVNVQNIGRKWMKSYPHLKEEKMILVFWIHFWHGDNMFVHRYWGRSFKSKMSYQLVSEKPASFTFLFIIFY